MSSIIVYVIVGLLLVAIIVVILNQQSIISRLDNNQTTEVNTLYHGAILTSLAHNNKKLQALIDAHNEMIQVIEQATGKPAIVKNTYIHNSYCTVNQVYVPECHKKK